MAEHTEGRGGCQTQLCQEASSNTSTHMASVFPTLRVLLTLTLHTGDLPRATISPDSRDPSALTCWNSISLLKNPPYLTDWFAFWEIGLPLVSQWVWEARLCKKKTQGDLWVTDGVSQSFRYAGSRKKQAACRTLPKWHTRGPRWRPCQVTNTWWRACCNQSLLVLKKWTFQTVPIIKKI